MLDIIRWRLLVVGTLLFVGAVQSSAQVDTCLTDSLVISTGWDYSTNAIFGVGNYTSFWQVVSDPSTNTTEPRPSSVITPDVAWGGPLSSSQWISSYPSASNDTNGIYAFEFCFCIKGRPRNIDLVFDLLADDRAQVFINGTPVATTTLSYAFLIDSLTHVNTDITSLVTSGRNCIRIEVENTNYVAMGLNLAGYITSSGVSLENPLCCNDSAAGITGTKFYDLDCDGKRDSGEPGIAGWVITLSNGDTDTTDGLGNYYFNSLPSGTYTVSEIAQPGWAQSYPAFPGTHTVSLINSQVIGGLDFGNCDTTLQDPCIETRNDTTSCFNDGVPIFVHNFEIRSLLPCPLTQSASITPLMPGISVNPTTIPVSAFWTPVSLSISGPGAVPGSTVQFLVEVCCINFDPASGIIDTLDCCTDTLSVLLDCSIDTCDVDSLDISTGWDPNTNTLLSPGTTTSAWQVVADPIANTTEPRPANVITPFPWWQPNPLPGSQWINALPTAANPTIGLYAYERYFCVDDLAQDVWLNANVFTDNNSVIFLNGTQIATTPWNGFNVVTPVNQNITNLLVPGVNTLRIEVTNLWVPNLNASGLDVAGTIRGVGLQRFDCCEGTITGIKFNDLNCNGQRDSGEPGLPGWTITLNNGDVATTNALGVYSFPNLLPGTYVVSEVQQTGWTQTFPTAPGTHTVNVTAGQTVSGIDFGNCKKPCKDCCEDFPKAMFTLQWSSGSGNSIVGGVMQAGNSRICTVSATLVDAKINGQSVLGEFVPTSLLGSNPGTIPYMHEVVWTGVNVNATPTPFSLQLKFPPISSGFRDRIRYCIRFRFTDSNCVTCDTVVCFSQRRFRWIFDDREDDLLKHPSSGDLPFINDLWKSELTEEGDERLYLTLPESIDDVGDVEYQGITIVPINPDISIESTTHNVRESDGSFVIIDGLSSGSHIEVTLNKNGSDKGESNAYNVALHFSPKGHPEIVFKEEGILHLSRFSHESSTTVSDMTKGIKLEQSYPNPTEGSVTIPFSLQRSSSKVFIEVTDVSGEVVATIIDGKKYQAGEHSVEFQTDGLRVGTYFYTLRVGGMERTRAMQVVR